MSFLLGGLLTGVGTGIKTGAEEMGKDIRDRQRLLMADQLNKENATIADTRAVTAADVANKFTTLEREAGQVNAAEARENQNKFLGRENQSNREATATEGNRNRAAATARDAALVVANTATASRLAEVQAAAAKTLAEIQEAKSANDSVRTNAANKKLSELRQNEDTLRAELAAGAAKLAEERSIARPEEDIKAAAPAVAQSMEDATAEAEKAASWLIPEFLDFKYDREEYIRLYAVQLMEARRAKLPQPIFNKDDLTDELTRIKAGGSAQATSAQVAATTAKDAYKAALNPSPPPPPSAMGGVGDGTSQRTDIPQVGDVVRGHSFLGGDPRQATSWWKIN